MFAIPAFLALGGRLYSHERPRLPKTRIDLFTRGSHLIRRTIDFLLVLRSIVPSTTADGNLLSAVGG